MSERPLPDFVFAGPSKSASSWIYEALNEHPEILMPDIKPVSYFDTKYHNGLNWYQQVYSDYEGEKRIGDSSPGYLKNQQAPKRIKNVLGEAKILFCLRNPIDRAFSQWWMEYANGWITHEFKNVFYHHPDYDRLIAPGFYADHLERWGQYFHDDQIHVALFDDFVDDNAAFAEEIYSFLSVDPSYELSIVGEQINEARTEDHPAVAAARRYLPRWIKRPISPLYQTVSDRLESRDKYDEGMDPNVRKGLEVQYGDDIRRLSERLGRDLNHWLEYVDLDGRHSKSQVTYDEEFKRTDRSWNTSP
jgi:hypothetical protein